MTHIDLLELAEIPEHLLVLGGGYVGIESAQAFRRFADVESVRGESGTSVRLNIRKGESSLAIEGTHRLVATGQTPNTDHMGLELAGVEMTDRGMSR